MADAVLIDLVARTRPAPTWCSSTPATTSTRRSTMRDAVAATYRGRLNIVDRRARADRRRAGRRPRPRPVREQPRPVLRAAQGRAAGRGARRLRRVGHRPAPRRVLRPVDHTGRRLGQAQRQGQGQPDRPLDPGPRRRLHRGERHPRQPAADGRLRLDRLLPVHPPGRPTARARAPGAGPARASPSAGIHLVSS